MQILTWSIITHPFIDYNGGLTKPAQGMDYHIPRLSVDVITYPCPNPIPVDWNASTRGRSPNVILVYCGARGISWYSGPLFTKKTPSYQYRDSHYKPETVVRPS